MEADEKLVFDPANEDEDDEDYFLVSRLGGGKGSQVRSARAMCGSYVHALTTEMHS